MKSSNIELNSRCLEKLLDLQNDFLWKCLGNYSVFLSNTSPEYKNLKTVDMIDVGIENIQEIVELSPSLNILEIFDDVDYFCHITRYLFSLHAILDKLSLTDKYQTKYMSVLSIIFRVIKNASSNENATRFSYITLNAMLTNTLSSEEM